MDSQSFHFGAWLKRTLEDTGETFSAFCKKADIPMPSLMRWFKERRPPIRPSNLVRLARGLGVTRKYLEERLAEAEAAVVAA